MGKGLGLQKDGIHVTFVGGTGVLTFMDLVALLIRQNLGLLTSGKVDLFEKGASFKFVLYASFHTRVDAVGLELLEGLRDIS